MSKLYESSRNQSIQMSPSQAILKGLSDDGGLFVLKDLYKQKVNLDSILQEDYYGIAKQIVSIFMDDFSVDEVTSCVNQAYQGKFSEPSITPLKQLKDAYLLELFHGPTSAFKDIGLSLLPQLTKVALKKTKADYEILILTATSGDTGIAALEGFKNVDKTKIIVFYPRDGVSKVQETQMKTLAGNNVRVCAIEGNFDDAQNGIKQLFVDDAFKDELATQQIRVSSANSINIGRLIPQIVYYFSAYASLVSNSEIKQGEEVNFIVPTGNFGNILAGYYAKLLGLPVHKLVCAANDNNVLYDFIKTGVYDRNRPFLKTISPSMDILISSNLERFLYYISDCDTNYVKEKMDELQTTGTYKISDSMLAKMHEIFDCGFATNEETAATIRTVYDSENYLLDPHTAVAYKVLLDQKDTQHKNIVLSTASPYKFTNSVYEALHDKTNEDEFQLMKQLNEETKVCIPANLKDLDSKDILHKDCIKKEDMKEYVLKASKEM